MLQCSCPSLFFPFKKTYSFLFSCSRISINAKIFSCAFRGQSYGDFFLCISRSVVLLFMHSLQILSFLARLFIWIMLKSFYFRFLSSFSDVVLFPTLCRLLYKCPARWKGSILVFPCLVQQNLLRYEFLDTLRWPQLFHSLFFLVKMDSHFCSSPSFP